MADYSAYRPNFNSQDYITKYDNFITASESVAQEVEDARGAEASLSDNLANYISYTLVNNINGSATSGTGEGTSTSTTLVDTSVDFTTLGLVAGVDIVIDVTDTVSGTPITATISTINTNSLVTSDITPNTWNGTVYSVGGYKLENMAAGTNSSDYVTLEQVSSMLGSGVSSITDVGPGALNANDILVINGTGTAIEGRPTAFWTSTNLYVPVTSTFTADYNDNIHFNVGGGGFVITLPAGRIGAIIRFADLDGTVGTNTLSIVADGTEKIMQTISAPSEYLLIDEYPHISFSLVYVNDTFGWAIIDLQR